MSITTDLTNVHLTRQADLIPISILGEPITIIGVGAVGSLVAMNLVKMGFSDLTIIDFDTVTLENMNCQGYRFKDVGKLKVKALVQILKDYGDDTLDIKASFKPYERGTFPGIVIAAVDSMKVRKLIWENHKLSVSTKFILDPRMSIEEAKLYCMNPLNSKDVESYEKTLFKDEDGVSERCTMKATIYTASMLAGLVSKTVKDVLLKQEYARVTEWAIHSSSMNSWKTRVQ